MKNRNLNHKDDWATPKKLYDELDAEFNFDFDPCPLNSDFDGLEIDWGNNIFINFGVVNTLLWNQKINLDAQNVLNINQPYTFPLGRTEKEDTNPDVGNAFQLKIQNETEINGKIDVSIQKNINYYSTDKHDALNVKLSNHSMKLISLLTRDAKLDIAPIVKTVTENIQENVCPDDEMTRLRQILSNIKEINIVDLIKAGKVDEKAALLEIINIEDNFLNGHVETGSIVNRILKINVPIAEQRQILLKIILSLYHVISTPEQYHQIWFRHVSNATPLKAIKNHMNGVHPNLLSILMDISNISLKIEHVANVFINPPYSRKLKEAFIRKAYEESLKGNLCVMLLPVSTSTKIFHEVIYPNAEIRFLKGRVRFIGINTFGLPGNCTPMHDSMVVIFYPGKQS